MSRIKKFAKWSLMILAGSIVALAGFGWWFMSLLSASNSSENIKDTLPSSLPYLTDHPVQKRGKILAVVTSIASFPTTGKITGYELTELAQAYYVFVANGFEVDIASTMGGEPRMVIDEEDMTEYDYAFLNDSLAMLKVKGTISMENVLLNDYEAIYFVGGKGAMFDFPDNKSIQEAVKTYHEQGKIIGAVCHGPAALVHVKLADGTFYLRDRKVSSFTNNEELFLIEDAPEIFPFMLQDKLTANGARYSEGAMYLENVVVDGNLVTGQNPWSTWTLAEAMVKQLGYEPKQREKTAAENAVLILKTYEISGYKNAKRVIEELNTGENKVISRDLIAMHALVAGMQWKISKGFGILGLLRHIKATP